MQVLAEAGVFHLRLCKLCDEGVVVKGEYGLTAALFEKGLNIATLMSKYPAGLDWRDQKHWDCNNNVHPSRHGEILDHDTAISWGLLGTRWLCVLPAGKGPVQVLACMSDMLLPSVVWLSYRTYRT